MAVFIRISNCCGILTGQRSAICSGRWGWTIVLFGTATTWSSCWQLLRRSRTLIILSLLFSCFGLVLSAAFLSPAILNIFHLKAVLLGRKLHMAFTVWSFILMSIHIGSHWNMIAGTIKKRLDPLRWYPVAIKIIGTLLSAYGAYSFWIRGFPQRMFLRTKYVFFDYNESLLACFGSHIAIQCFIVCFVYCVMSVRTVLWSRFKNGV